MTDIGDNESSTLSTNTSSILIPVTTDKTALIWDGNDATIKGLLYECGQYYKRKGLFQPLIKHRTVSLSNGKLALEDPNTVYFTTCPVATCLDFFLDINRARRARKFFRHMVTFAPFWATGETYRTETKSALGVGPAGTEPGCRDFTFRGPRALHALHLTYKHPYRPRGR